MITKYAPECPVLLSEVQSGVLTLDLYLLGLISAFTAVRGYESVCCFVLLEPTPEEYRVPRVSPGVTASKLFSPTSVAGYGGPSSAVATEVSTYTRNMLSHVSKGVRGR